jgi:hypothetical protein
MNMKPIDLQMAIPRATEVGRVQQQMQHKPQQDQAMLQQTNSKDSEIAAQKPTEVDKSEQDAISKDEKKEKQNQENEQKKRTRNAKQYANKTEDAEHPYKGKNLDLSL